MTMPLETVADRAAFLAAQLQKLDPGPLARLRRMETDEPATEPAFWRLVAPFNPSEDRVQAWQQVVRILAILTPRGDAASRPELHDPRRPLGAALCDGGSRHWPEPGVAEPRPVLSEQRLARFAALPLAARAGGLERLARGLARSRDPDAGIDCADIAALLLFSDPSKPMSDLVRQYYLRLDRAHRAASSQPNGEA
jgi:CRISPR system Cascade subunit CasB